MFNLWPYCVTQTFAQDVCSDFSLCSNFSMLSCLRRSTLGHAFLFAVPNI